MEVAVGGQEPDRLIPDQRHANRCSFQVDRPKPLAVAKSARIPPARSITKQPWALGASSPESGASVPTIRPGSGHGWREAADMPIGRHDTIAPPVETGPAMIRCGSVVIASPTKRGAGDFFSDTRWICPTSSASTTVSGSTAAGDIQLP